MCGESSHLALCKNDIQWLNLYEGTTAFAFINMIMTLNSAFYGMKLVEMFGGNNDIDIGLINV